MFISTNLNLHITMMLQTDILAYISTADSLRWFNIYLLDPIEDHTNLNHHLPKNRPTYQARFQMPWDSKILLNCYFFLNFLILLNSPPLARLLSKVIKCQTKISGGEMLSVSYFYLSRFSSSDVWYSDKAVK